ncbi:MAG: EFR1 family ferrodoxin [Oscillospiraceae bacterium]
MKISKLRCVYFSATGSTRAVLTAIAEGFPLLSEEIDITNFSEREKSYQFTSDELVVFGIPVYGGRIPVPAAESLKKMRGSQTPAVLVAVYGNREFDDALLELKNITEENGFTTVAAAAFIAEHSVMHSVAAGRPDAEDEAKIHAFAAQAWAKLQATESAAALPALKLRGNFPYVEFGGIPLKPHATKACTGCGACSINCPMGAIPAGNPRRTDKNLCISCMRCMDICPQNARRLNRLMLAAAEKSFAKKCAERREPEIFI